MLPLSDFNVALRDTDPVPAEVLHAPYALSFGVQSV